MMTDTQQDRDRNLALFTKELRLRYSKKSVASSYGTPYILQSPASFIYLLCDELQVRGSFRDLVSFTTCCRCYLSTIYRRFETVYREKMLKFRCIPTPSIFNCKDCVSLISVAVCDVVRTLKRDSPIYVMHTMPLCSSAFVYQHQTEKDGPVINGCGGNKEADRFMKLIDAQRGHEYELEWEYEPTIDREQGELSSYYIELISAFVICFYAAFIFYFCAHGM